MQTFSLFYRSSNSKFQDYKKRRVRHCTIDEKVQKQKMTKLKANKIKMSFSPVSIHFFLLSRLPDNLEYFNVVYGGCILRT